jgi:hypothetical protein
LATDRGRDDHAHDHDHDHNHGHDGGGRGGGDQIFRARYDPPTNFTDAFAAPLGLHSVRWQLAVRGALPRLCVCVRAYVCPRAWCVVRERVCV